MSGGVSLGKESGTVMGSFDKYIKEIKFSFDAEIELLFPVGSSKGLQSYRIDGLSLIV